MKYCEVPCEGCPVARIEDPEARQAAQEHVYNVFWHFQPQELRSAEGTEWAGRLITSANATRDLESGEVIVPDNLDMGVVRAAVTHIAREDCPPHRDVTHISLGDNYGKDF